MLLPLDLSELLRKDCSVLRLLGSILALVIIIAILHFAFLPSGEWDTWWRAATASLVATSGGILIGLPVSLRIGSWLERRRHFREIQAQQRALLDRQLRALEIVRGEFKHNHDLIDQVVQQLTGGEIPTFELDMNAWPMVAPDLAEATSSDEFSRLSLFFYECQHLSNRLRQIMAAETSTEISIRDQLLGGTLVLFQNAHPFADEVLEMLDGLIASTRSGPS